MQMKDRMRICRTQKAVCIGGLGNEHGGWWLAGSIAPNYGVHIEIFDIEIYFDGTGYLLCYATEGNLFYGDSWHTTELDAKISAREDLGVNPGDWIFA